MADEWFYWSNDKQFGPVSETELKTMAETGTLRPEDLIWKNSMREWLPAGRATDWKFGPAPTSAVQDTASPPMPTLSYAARSNEPLVLSPRILDLLRQTRPWVRFFAILLYIAAGIMAVGGLIMVVLVMTTSQKGAPGMVGIGLLYVVLAVVYYFPASYLNRFASRITYFVNMRRNIDLEEALDAQRFFWKFCGVLAIIILCGYVIAVGVAIAMR